MRSILFAALILLGALCVVDSARAQLADAKVDDYNQWKLALQAGAVADPARLTTRPGFQVDLIHVARPEEGSWVSLAFDPQGRLVVGREDKGLLRFTLSGDRRRVDRVETIEDTLLECRGLLFAHGSLYAHANNTRALYRLRDTDGDDRFDEVRLLRKTEGGVGHGRNGLALGPDGMLYLAMGNNVRVPEDSDVDSSPLRRYAIDRLLPCVWNEFLFDADVVPPAGHVVRTDPDGKNWELFAGGFRNPYGIAFNAEGELFTYDADMEWDEGAPWYRPTTVIHVVSGADYGWRQETNCWPDHFADTLPRVVDIGLGSPTGVKFGEKSSYPEPYRRAFYILDWAYGRIIAVHLTPRGASYAGRAETFLKGKPLNVTDLDFGPDGAMYFVVGGRRTQSALYRVRWGGEKENVNSSSAPAVPPRGTEGEVERARKLRQTLARFHVSADPVALDEAWPHLGSDDPYIRHAARIAVERQPVDTWQARALAEKRPTAALTALLALARVGTPEQRGAVLRRLDEWALQDLDLRDRLIAWRAWQLALLRLGPTLPDDAHQSATRIAKSYPGKSPAENQLLCELLVTLDPAAAIAPTLDRIDSAQSSEERLFYLFALRQVERGWTLEGRRRYVEWLKRAENFPGSNYLDRFVTFIRTDALDNLTDEHRQALEPVLRELGRSIDVAKLSAEPRAEIRRWTLEDLATDLEAAGHGRDFLRGKAMFTQATCVWCHRMRGAGGVIGPDLTGVGSRFGRGDLLESILAPAKVVDEKYRDLVLETDTGRIFTGRLVGGDATTLAIASNLLEPTRVDRVPRAAIVERRQSTGSIMPDGLLNTLTRDEILDLLAYLESGGDAEHAAFRQK